MRPISDALREHLIGPDADAREIVEARGVTNEDLIQRKDQWNAANSVVGFSISDGGVVRLAGSDTALLDQTTGAVTTEIQDMERFPFDAHIGSLAIIDWGGNEDADMPITEITAHLDPDQDGPGGTGVEVAFWRLQLWRLDEYRIDPAGVVVFESMTAIGDYVEEAAGGSAADVVFTFDATNPPRPKRFGPPTLLEETTTPAYDFFEGSAVTLVSIWGVQTDGSKATNTAWSVDTGASSLTTSNNRLRAVNLTKFVEGEWTTSQEAFVPRMKISTANYAASATITFTTNPLDLSAAPASADNVVFAGVANEPGSTSVTFEVAVAGSGTWVTYIDGQSATDLGLAANQTYDVRATLFSGTASTSTPELHILGVTDRTSTIIDGPVTVDLMGGWRAILTPALVGEVPEAVIGIQRDGERDYRDIASDLLADNAFDDLEFRVYVGFGDEDDRADWTLIDTFYMDDVRFREPVTEFICLGVMQQLDQVLPVPPATDSDPRTRLEYANQTLKAAYEDLIQNQALLPDRHFGPGIEDATTTVTNKISPKENSKVLRELHALAALAGGVVTTSQGRVVFRLLHDQGNAVDVAAVLPREEIASIHVTPGYRQRTPQHYMRWDYDFDGSEEFQQEERRTNVAALNAYDPYGLERDPFAPDYVGRWVDVEALAAAYTRRVTETMGFGLMVWDVQLITKHPELEVGDMVALNTDLLVARDPTITGRVLRGNLWAVARVTAVGDVMGQRLQVWVQHYSDYIPAGDTGSVTGVVIPAVESASWEMDASRNVSSVLTCNRFSRSIKVATSTSAYPSEATVRAAAPQALTDGRLETGTLESAVAFQGTVFLSAFAYEGPSAAGNESVLFKAVMIAGRFSDLDEVPDGSTYTRILLSDTTSNRIKKLLANTEVEGNLYVPNTGSPVVGTVAAPSSLTKTLMIAYLDLLPEAESDKWRVGAGDGRHVQPNAVSDQLDLFGRAVLPRGVTITAVRARFDRNAVGDTAILFFGRRGRTTDGSAVTNLATLTHATTGWATLSDSSVSETVSDDVYVVHVRLTSTSAAADAKFGWCEIDYTMPSYDKGY